MDMDEKRAENTDVLNIANGNTERRYVRQFQSEYEYERNKYEQSIRRPEDRSW